MPPFACLICPSGERVPSGKSATRFPPLSEEIAVRSAARSPRVRSRAISPTRGKNQRAKGLEYSVSLAMKRTLRLGDTMASTGGSRKLQWFAASTTGPFHGMFPVPRISIR